jgi:hypothetical protein
MEILPYKTPSAAVANVTSLIQAVVVSPADLTTIKQAQSRLANISEIDGRVKPDRSQQPGQEWRSYWHLRVDEILSELGDNPSFELAEQAHAAIVRASQASLSCQPISEALRAAASRESLSLAPISARVIDMALANLDREATAHREAMPADTMFVGDSVLAFERTLAALRSALEAERPESQRDPQFWLWMHGIGADIEPAPTPKPLPAVKQPRRGVVELPASDLAAEMAGDLH